MELPIGNLRTVSFCLKVVQDVLVVLKDLGMTVVAKEPLSYLVSRLGDPWCIQTFEGYRQDWDRTLNDGLRVKRGAADGGFYLDFQ